MPFIPPNSNNVSPSLQLTNPAPPLFGGCDSRDAMPKVLWFLPFDISSVLLGGGGRRPMEKSRENSEFSCPLPLLPHHSRGTDSAGESTWAQSRICVCLSVSLISRQWIAAPLTCDKKDAVYCQLSVSWMCPVNVIGNGDAVVATNHQSNSRSE